MQIKFIKPISKRGNYSTRNLGDAYLNAYIKGKNRKQNCFEINIKQFINKNKLGWKYVQIGFDENNKIYICEGTSENGYPISRHNKSICNKIIVQTLIERLDLRVPIKADELVKVYFNAVKVQTNSGFFNIYELIKN